jgi:hypothetical protein
MAESGLSRITPCAIETNRVLTAYQGTTATVWLDLVLGIVLMALGIRSQGRWIQFPWADRPLCAQYLKACSGSTNDLCGHQPDVFMTRLHGWQRPGADL